MTESKIGNGLSDIKVETNFSSAPVEQQSPEPVETISPSKRATELVTTEPKIENIAEIPESIPETPATLDANNAARRAFEAEIRAEAAEKRALENAPKQKQFAAEPDLNNYETLEAWKSDYRDYWKQQSEKEFSSAQVAKQQQEESIKIKAEVRAKAQESRTKHADFDQVVSPLAQVMDSIPVLSDFIARNPMGTEVAYELAKNPAFLDQIMRSKDMWATGEQLLNIAARLKKPAVVQVSQAPEPIKPVGSRETARVNVAELASKDINGFMALKKKQKLARLRAN